MLRSFTRDELCKYVSAHASTFDRNNANPFASSVWFRHFLTQVASDNWRFWIAAYGDKSLMLLYSEASSPTQLHALTNYYASLYTPIIGDTDPASVAAVTRELNNAERMVSSVELAPLAEQECDVAIAGLQAAGWITRRYTCFGNWYLPCNNLSFDDYMAMRPSQLLNTWTRKAKKFTSGSEGARLQLISAITDVEVGIQAYETVYAKSWKQPEPYPHFVAEWARRCAENGWLRLGIAWLGETPIAVQFWFVIDERAYIFKLAYDDTHSKLSAGTVLSAFLFKHALDVDRVNEIDYLTGDDTYKRSWMNKRRERVGIIACNPRTLRGALRSVWEIAGAKRQQLRRRLIEADAE